MKAPPFALGKTIFGALGKPVLIGSVFYKSDRKVLDHRKGKIDLNILAKEQRSIKIMKDRVGLDHALDVIAETPEAMERYMGILAETTEEPILVGGLNEETRIAGYRKAKEIGIEKRCGVNSIGPAATQNELGELKENAIRFAILQTLDPTAVYPEEKSKLLEESLLPKCEQAGISMAAVDVGIIDFASVWLAGESIKKVKAELCLPAGCAPSNAAYQPLVAEKITKKSARSINVALSTMVLMSGADFLFYGPLKASTYIFEAAAVVEGIKAYGARVSGSRIADKNHPLYKFLPKLM